MKRTVAFVSAYYPPHMGGVENYVARVAEALARTEDLEPVVITTRESGRRTTVDVEGGVKVIRLGSWLKVSNSPLSPLWPFQVRRWLHRTGAEVVNAHAPVPGLADIAIAVAGKRRKVLTYHAGTMRKAMPGTRVVDWVLERYEKHVLSRLFKSVDVPVPVGPSSMAAKVPGAVLITPGVDIERFTPGPPASTRPRDIVYVGRMDRTSAWKGVDVLLQAFALLQDLPEVRLRLVGSGDALPDYLDLAKESGIAERIDAGGALGGDTLVEAMQQAAVMVLASTTDAECAGTVTMEAMACATPVVASDVGSLAYVVPNGKTGIIVPPGDAAALAEACRTVLCDGELADRLGAAGRERAVGEFAWPLLADRYISLFRSI